MTLRVVLAFLVPILVFIVSLAAFERMLRPFTATRYSTAIGLVLALVVTAISVGISRAAYKRL